MRFLARRLVNCLDFGEVVHAIINHLMAIAPVLPRLFLLFPFVEVVGGDIAVLDCALLVVVVFTHLFLILLISNLYLFLDTYYRFMKCT